MKTTPTTCYCCTAILLLIIVICSCQRRPVIEYTGAWVRVQIDWETAQIEPNGASVYFFPKQGGTPFVLWTNHTLDSIYLPIGNYDVLVHNERVSEYTNIAFRGTGAYETFEAYAHPDLSTPDFLQYQSMVNPEISKTTKAGTPVAEPDVLAVAHHDDFSLTQGMTIKGAGPLLEFTPQRLTAELTVTAHITGLQYAAAPSGSGGYLSGMVEGIMLATEEHTEVSTTQYFTFRHAEFNPGSAEEGIMEAMFYTFGPHQKTDSPKKLWLQFLLRDGEIYTPDERDVTGRFVGTRAAGKIVLSLSVGLRKWAEDTPIELPYAEAGDGIFTVDVSNWGDGTIIDTKL